MGRTVAHRSGIPLGIALSLAIAAVALLAACARPSAEPVAAADAPPAPTAPAAPDLTTPEAAVRSYLRWVSFAYRMANSEIPTRTMTAYEGVRVDAYIELNRQKNRAIDQQVVGFERRSVSAEATTAVLAAREKWRYRYFALDDMRYLGAWNDVSYETTYTLVKERTGWLVDKVQVEALTAVK